MTAGVAPGSGLTLDFILDFSRRLAANRSGMRINHFEAVEADSAAAGLKAFEESGFDLVIVDVFLRDTNGVDLIMKMRERRADLPVVAISGMTTLGFVTESPELSDVVCLQKPFRPNELMAAIERVRAKHPAAGGAAVA